MNLVLLDQHLWGVGGQNIFVYSALLPGISLSFSLLCLLSRSQCKGSVSTLFLCKNFTDLPNLCILCHFINSFVILKTKKIKLYLAPCKECLLFMVCSLKLKAMVYLFESSTLTIVPFM